MNRRPALVFICLLFIAETAFAQTTEAKKVAPPTNNVSKSKPAVDPEAERIIRERRAQAQAMLISLAADAGSYNDQRLRARTQARIADVLWDADPERARTLFRKAWDAAETADKESQQRLQEEVQQQKAKTGSVAVSGPPNVRGEVLRLAARRDRALGEDFLAKLRVEKQQEITEAADKAKADPFNSSAALSQRLNLARQLLDTDVPRALQFRRSGFGRHHHRRIELSLVPA